MAMLRRIARGYWPSVLRGYTAGIGSAGARAGIRVFTYHGVVEGKTTAFLERNFHEISDFRRHVAFFRRCRTVHLDQVAREIGEWGTVISPGVAITFDDGYQNNVVAAEILEQARLPWTVFVSTGALGAGTAIWTVELSLLLLHGDCQCVEFGRPWSLRTNQERHAAFQAIRYELKSRPAGERRQSLEHIRNQFPPQHLAELLERYPTMRMMSWRDVHALDIAGVTVGSHGVEHELHHAGQSDDVCRAEAVESKHVLEQQLGHSCDYFAFPNGDFRDGSTRLLADAGYRLGFSTRRDTIYSGYDRYTLPRLSPPADLAACVREYFWDR